MKQINVLGQSYKVSEMSEGGLFIQHAKQSNFAEVLENGEFRKAFQKRGFTEKERAAIRKALGQ